MPSQMYGSGGHLRPPGPGDSLLTYYTKCSEPMYGPNAHVKSIVQPRYTLTALDPHHFAYTEGHHAVGSDFVRVMALLIQCKHWSMSCKSHLADGLGCPGPQVDGPMRHPPVLDKIVLQHYFSKSWTDFLHKAVRGSGDGGRKGWPAFVEMENHSAEDCEPILDSVST